MSETSRRKRPGVLVVAAVLAVPAFGGGVLVGKSPVEAASEQTPSGADERTDSAPKDAVSIELEACQEKWARRTKAPATASAMEARPEQPKEATAEEQRQIEALEREIKTCRRSEMVHGASVCKTVRRHFDLMMALPDNGKSCRDKRFVVNLIKMNFERCTNFGDVPADLEAQDLTDEERLTVLDAVDVAKSLTKEELAQLDQIYPACLKKSGKRY